KMSGFPDEEALLGKRLTDLFASEKIHTIDDLSEAIDAQKGDRVEMAMIDHGGEMFFVEVSEKDVQTGGGEVIGRAFSMIDITLRKEIQAALKASRLQLKNLSAKLVEAQEAERRRVARELHDGVGASLSALKFSVEHWFEKQKRPDGATCSPPDEIVAAIQQIIEEVRRVSQNLHPSILDDLGLATAVRSFCRQQRENHPGLDIDADIRVDDQRLSKRIQLVIYRMVQECTTNAIRHGNADRIQIDLKPGENREILLEVRDNGEGFDAKATWDGLESHGGIGLTSMSERAELTGGRLSIDSRIGKGSVFRCRWPLG
ncbi:MAG: histidine kinase, partial [Desulfobacterales bacterium]